MNKELRKAYIAQKFTQNQALFLQACNRIKEYVDNPMSFILDLKNFGIKEDFDIYFDFMQYIPHCKIINYIKNKELDYLITQYNTTFAMMNGWGYKTSETLFAPNYSPYRQISHHPIDLPRAIKLLQFLGFEASPTTIPFKLPRICGSLLFMAEKRMICNNLLKDRKQICDECKKYNSYEQRSQKRFEEVSMLPTRDNLIDRAPEIVLLNT